MNKTTLIAVGLGLVFLAAGCGGGDNPDLFSVQIKKAIAEKTYDGANPDPASGAVAVRLTVTGPGMDTRSKESDIGVGGSAVIGIPEFPEGDDRQFTFEFLGPANPLKNNERPVIGRGRSASLTVDADAVRAPDRIYVAPVNSMVRPTTVDDETGLVVSSLPVKASRVGASMTELDDGRILICGGAQVRAEAETWYMPDDLNNLTDTCETYDPKTGLFTEVANRMNVKRAYHQAVKLGSPDNPDGRVVLIGGYTVPDGGTITVTNLVDIFNPKTGLFISATSNEGQPGLYGGQGRALFTADLVNADKNLIVLFGGYSNVSAVGGTYDIVWVTEGSVMTIAHAQLFNKEDPAKGIVRYNHALAKVRQYADELVEGNGYQAYLLLGGENESGVIDTIEPYVITCPGVDACKLQRQDQLVVKIPGGARSMPVVAYDKLHNFLFVAGGFGAKGGKSPTDRVEIFRVSNANFRENEVLSLGSKMGGMSIAEMDDGRFLLAGGWDGTKPVDAVKIVSPKGPVIQNGQEIETPAVKSAVPTMDAARAGHSMLTDQTGRVLIFGGIDAEKDSPEPIFYNPGD